MKRDILIATHAIGALESTVARLARVARKLKLSPEPSLAIDWSTKKERTRRRITALVDMDGETAESHEVESITVVSATITLPDTGEVRAQGGWNLVGELSRTDTGLETRAFRAVDLPLLATYRDANLMECQHCRAKRNRSKTLIVRNTAGDVKQVGRECGHNYLTDVAQAIGELEFQETVFSLIRMPGDEDEDGDFMGGWGGAKILTTFAVDEALAAIVAEIRRNGFVKSSDTDQFGNTFKNDHATWRNVRRRLCEHEPHGATEEDMGALAFHLAHEPDRIATQEFVHDGWAITVARLQSRIDDARELRRRWLELEPTAEDQAKAAELIAWIEALQVDLAENEFLANLQDTVRSGFASEHKLALLAALPAAKDRADREAKRAVMIANRSEPAPVGRVWVEGRVLKFDERHSDWGTVIKWTVELDNGCRVWTTVPDGVEHVVGARVGFTATFERSDRDEFFSFGSRPTLVRPKEKKPKRAKALVTAGGAA